MPTVAAEPELATAFGGIDDPLLGRGRGDSRRRLARGWRLGEARRAANAQWTVVDVLDGDTIRVARGHEADTVRLLGVDTPDWR